MQVTEGGTPRAHGDRPIDSNAGDILRRTDREPRNREKLTEMVGYDRTEREREREREREGGREGERVTENRTGAKEETRWRLLPVARESASSRERTSHRPRWEEKVEEEMGGSYEEAGRERVGAFVRDREGASACEESEREGMKEQVGGGGWEKW